MLISIPQKLLKDANFLSVYIISFNMYVYVISLHSGGGRWTKTDQSSYGLCKTWNKQCGSCLLTTKLVTQTLIIMTNKRPINKFKLILNLLESQKTVIFVTFCNYMYLRYTSVTVLRTRSIWTSNGKNWSSNLKDSEKEPDTSPIG